MIHFGLDGTSTRLYSIFDKSNQKPISQVNGLFVSDVPHPPAHHIDAGRE